jgi:hypothetical protein
MRLATSACYTDDLQRAVDLDALNSRNSVIEIIAFGSATRDLFDS